MGIAFKQLKETMAWLDEMQESHIHAFEAHIPLDLEQQIIQRQQGFSHLKRAVTTALQEPDTLNPAERKSMIQAVDDQMLSLIRQNRVLKSRVETLKNELENSLKKITRGRQMINAYGSSQRNQPKVIDFKK